MTQLEFNVDAMLHTLRSNPELPVIFMQHEQAISPGYHITEIKSSVVNSLDCGQGTDQWRELVIQLLDGNAKNANSYMQSTKMLSILEKALKTVPSDAHTQLYFEFSPGNAQLSKSRISAIEVKNHSITVSLFASIAQCKPYQRALAAGNVASTAKGCCAPSPVSTGSCCDNSNASSNSPCCQ